MQTTYTGFPSFSFFFNDTATTEIYTLSLHDALPISSVSITKCAQVPGSSWSSESATSAANVLYADEKDRKSTRLNSSHVEISYAVFCLKKKKNKQQRMKVQPTHR